jgi:hypothetical protein
MIMGEEKRKSGEAGERGSGEAGKRERLERKAENVKDRHHDQP